MLAFTIIGGITQARKKKNQAVTSNANGGEKPKNDFWETLLGEDEVVQDQAEHFAEVFGNGVEEEVIPSKEYVREARVAAPRMHIKDEIKKSEIRDGKKKKSVLSGFSLRKAVVYSEIINRKYS